MMTVTRIISIWNNVMIKLKFSSKLCMQFYITFRESSELKGAKRKFIHSMCVTTFKRMKCDTRNINYKRTQIFLKLPKKFIGIFILFSLSLFTLNRACC